MNVVAESHSSCDNDGTVGSTLSTDSLNGEDVANLILDDDENEAPARIGRDQQESTLLEAFQRVQGGTRSEIVVVHGSKGTGKSSLVETLRVPVSKQGGYYVSGRFDQPPKTRRRQSSIREPFHAVSGALSDLCDLVTQSDDRDQESIRSQMVKEKDGEKEANVLMQFVGGSAVTLLSDPSGEVKRRDSLVSVSNTSSASASSSSTSSERRKQTSEVRSSLKRGCRRLLHALATPTHPVVLFLDNLHWADFASLDLIRYLIADSESSNILFVCAFRNDSGASLMKCLCRTARIHLPQQTMELENLDETETHRLVAQLLYQRQSTSVLAKTQALAEAVHTKTKGNPRGIIRYLEKLERYGVLHRRRTNGWVWDIGRIQRHANLGVSPSPEAAIPTNRRVHPQLETCFRQLSTSYANILNKIELANEGRKRRQGAVSPSLQRGRPRTDTH
uniref:Orc1-like AAA ATPase domain-containing protein n=1 Tax=Cyclophora tenuis TaxID=216820 RepID=A0A7S1DC56_CYCTE|mmetsp:Transcript_7410/g.12872  ORF Transcript_7410/g.12872 Transcript_7410/m.12872 type:complete len:448 (+) Transcript_7410:184-1527(+)|eukprot:CAMPEP_0116573900 /NCGR_PEP_ID=MMETSP0397-20121206/19070_1 /TAXON_ID=216820 /ORGANISM="Cyclophora tenuis, Strain ECT3854" /LENGTH=447 /DNA_ID=CAMNT_0004102555 /DNA_START=110 /DNA_END=1453 /DNA_ORIENTATION=-